MSGLGDYGNTDRYPNSLRAAHRPIYRGQPVLPTGNGQHQSYRQETSHRNTQHQQQQQHHHHQEQEHSHQHDPTQAFHPNPQTHHHLSNTLNHINRDPSSQQPMYRGAGTIEPWKSRLDDARDTSLSSTLYHLTRDANTNPSSLEANTQTWASVQEEQVPDNTQIANGSTSHSPAPDNQAIEGTSGGNLVELRSGRFLIKQRQIQLEKHESTQKALDDFVTYLKSRTNFSPIPPQYHPIVAQLVHESEKSLEDVSERIISCVRDHEAQTKAEPGSTLSERFLNTTLLSPLVESLAERVNYGLHESDVPSDLLSEASEARTLPAACRIWRWEVTDTNLLPQSLRAKLSARQVERRQGRHSVLEIFRNLPDEAKKTLVTVRKRGRPSKAEIAARNAVAVEFQEASRPSRKDVASSKLCILCKKEKDIASFYRQPHATQSRGRPCLLCADCRDEKGDPSDPRRALRLTPEARPTSRAKRLPKEGPNGATASNAQSPPNTSTNLTPAKRNAPVPLTSVSKRPATSATPSTSAITAQSIRLTPDLKRALQTIKYARLVARIGLADDTDAFASHIADLDHVAAMLSQ